MAPPDERRPGAWPCRRAGDDGRLRRSAARWRTSTSQPGTGLLPAHPQDRGLCRSRRRSPRRSPRRRGCRCAACAGPRARRAMSARASAAAVFARSFSFCFVRNPWDWTVSGWKHVTRQPGCLWRRGPGLRRLRHRRTGARGCAATPTGSSSRRRAIFVAYHTQITQWEHLLLGRIRPQPVPLAFTARFERLEDDWARICERLGRDIALPRINVSAGAHYTEYYDDRLREIVARRNAPLIARSATGSESDPRETPMTSLHIPELTPSSCTCRRPRDASISTALAEAFPEAHADCRRATCGGRHGTARHLVARVGLPPLEPELYVLFRAQPLGLDRLGLEARHRSQGRLWRQRPRLRGIRDGRLASRPLPRIPTAQVREPRALCNLSTPRSPNGSICASAASAAADAAGLHRPLRAARGGLGADLRAAGPRHPAARINVSAKSHYTEYYDDRLREIVARRNAPLIARFGYRFGA